MFGLPDLVECDDQRKHYPDISMHRGAQQRPKLRLEKLRLVQAHPDGAPAKEWVRIGRVAANGQLVAADVESSNHHRTSAERFHHVTVGAVLFLLVRHRGATDDQKLGAHEPDTFRTAVGSEL